MTKRKIQETELDASDPPSSVSTSIEDTDHNETISDMSSTKPTSAKDLESSTSPGSSSKSTINIVENTGDIFSAPENTVLIHACNCEGLWGAGIAKAFHDNYPTAYTLYHDHCAQHEPTDLIGTALLIAPQKSDPKHFIGCLFTSRGKGRYKDTRAKILANTEPALSDLLRQMAELEGTDKPGDVWMCKINSGLFGVPWVKTKEVIEDITFESGLTITVMERE